MAAVSWNVVPKSALCLIPPLESCAQIQAIRAIHDSQFKRWMPHINLLYPFYEDTTDIFEACGQKLQNYFESEPFPAVKIFFDNTSFSHFTHASKCTLILTPDQATREKLQCLQGKIQQLFPNAGDKRFSEFQPHLSVGQFYKNNILKFEEKFAQDWSVNDYSFDWVVDKLFLISRKGHNDPFSVKQTILLNQNDWLILQ